MKRRGGFNPWKSKRQKFDSVPKTDSNTQLPPDGTSQPFQPKPKKDHNFDNDWRPFISLSDVSSGHFTRAKLQAATIYLEKTATETLDDLIATKRFMLDLNHIREELKNNWLNLDADVENRLEMVLGIFGIARTNLAVKATSMPSFPAIRARIKDLDDEHVTQLKDLKAHLLESVVTIKGTVIRVSNVRPICTWLTFKCSKCGTLFSTEQPWGVYTEPRKCDGAKCRSTTFCAMRSHTQTLTTDWQSIRVQETTPAEKGRVPRTLDCVLTADLCDVAVPGDIVAIKGRLRTSQGATTTSFQTSATIHSYYIAAVTVYNQKVLDSNKRSPNCGMNLTLLDYSAVQEIHAYKSELLKLLVASLCPSIYGNELVKAGLLLGLFGGTVKCSLSKDKVPVRGDPHVSKLSLNRVSFVIFRIFLFFDFFLSIVKF